MDNLNISIIGGGFMGSAIVESIAEAYPEISLTVADSNETVFAKFEKYSNVKTTKDITEAAKSANIIYLAVKPNVVPYILEQIKYIVTQDKLIVSVAAGVTTETIESHLNKVGVIRIMPNICAKVSEACLAYCFGKYVDETWEQSVYEELSTLGKAIKVEEKYMDAITGLSGSGPAYIFMMIEALSDGGVLCGLPRNIANELAAQTVYGSAKMYLENSKHAGELKDMVTSPGGTTIQGVKALEENRFRYALIKAVEEATRQSEKFSKNK